MVEYPTQEERIYLTGEGGEFPNLPGNEEEETYCPEKPPLPSTAFYMRNVPLSVARMTYNLRAPA